MSKRYTEGIAFDGAAILDNGVPITITEILNRLNRLNDIETDSQKSSVPSIISESDTPAGKIKKAVSDFNKAVSKIYPPYKRTASCSSSYHSEQYNKGNGNCDVCGEEMPF